MREPLVKPVRVTTRINVTPIIDVALVLVIILLITAPMLSLAELDVALPVARSRGPEEARFISITLDRDGRVAVDKDLVPDIAAIAPRLQALLQQDGGRDALVVLRADADLPHALVRQALAAARRGGARKLAVASQQVGGGRS